MRLTSSPRLLCALAFLNALPGALGVADGAPIAGPYTCAVPRALLCEGCASQLAIRLLPGGGCRISFTAPSPGAPTSPSGAAPEAPFTFVIESAPAAGATPGHWRSRLAGRHKPLAEARTAHARCFVFNGNEYCE
jgi:hypothetical protein